MITNWHSFPTERPAYAPRVRPRETRSSTGPAFFSERRKTLVFLRVCRRARASVSRPAVQTLLKGFSTPQVFQVGSALMAAPAPRRPRIGSAPRKQDHQSTHRNRAKGKQNETRQTNLRCVRALGATAQT